MFLVIFYRCFLWSFKLVTNCNVMILQWFSFFLFTLLQKKLWILFSFLVTKICRSRKQRLTGNYRVNLWDPLEKMCKMFKVNNRDKERRQWRRSGVFIVNFDHISRLIQVFTGNGYWKAVSFRKDYTPENTRFAGLLVYYKRYCYVRRLLSKIFKERKTGSNCLAKVWSTLKHLLLALP